MRSLIHTCVMAIVVLLFLCDAGCTEPLRIFIAKFSGPGTVGDSMMTTLYFELTKALTNQAEKGVWIVYGREGLRNSTYQTAVDAASVPSVRADIVVWGNVTPYGGGVVVQSYLAITPLAEERLVRPEQWRLERKLPSGDSVVIEMGLPRQFYDFEPFRVPTDFVQKYSSPEGVPLYNTQHGGQIIGHVNGAFSFVSVREDGIELKLDSGPTGWVHLTDLYRERIQASEFSQALLRYLRGDWLGAEGAFERILEVPDLPQGIRVDSLILLGVAAEKRGGSGVDYFRKAFGTNPFDRISAQYLILGELSRVARSPEGHDDPNVRQEISQLFERTGSLFPKDDPWMEMAKRFARQDP